MVGAVSEASNTPSVPHSEALREWRNYALAIARDFYFPGADQDDVEQEAMIGLWQAFERWDRDKGPLGSFVYLVVRRRLIDRLDWHLSRNHLSLTRSARVAAHDDVLEPIVDYLVDEKADPELIYGQREHLEELVRIVNEELSAIERRSVIGFANGLKYAEIGPAKQVDNALVRARAKFAA